MGKTPVKVYVHPEPAKKEDTKLRFLTRNEKQITHYLVNDDKKTMNTNLLRLRNQSNVSINELK